MLIEQLQIVVNSFALEINVCTILALSYLKHISIFPFWKYMKFEFSECAV